MRIAGDADRTHRTDRSARWLAAIVLAIVMLASLVVPALAAEPASAVGPDASAGPVASAPAATSTADPAPGPAAGPASTPSPSPKPAPLAPTLVLTPLLSPTATPWPMPVWPTTVTTLGSSVRFWGKGYGHGVGLNQYGARGRALGGQTAEQILAAYFKGTAPGTTSPTRPVRVLLLAGFSGLSSAPLVIYGRGGTWAVSGINAVFPADAMLRTWRTTSTVNAVTTTTWRVTVLAADRVTALYTGVVTGKPVVRPLQAATRLQLYSKPTTFDTYRGTLTLLLGSSSVSVVNALALDDYLRGVLPVEMPASWPREALRAQAVAARSYALRRLHPTTGSYDLFDDTRSQVYRGLKAENAVTNALIDAYPGAIQTYAGSVVNAFFFSTGGGATESNEYAFGSSSGKPGTPVSYLRGIIDRSSAGVPWDATAPYYSWSTSALTRAQLTAMFKADSRTNVGDLQKLDLRRRGVSGRLYAVVLYGSTGTKTVSGDVFRSVYNARRPAGTLPLLSNLFDTKPIP